MWTWKNPEKTKTNVDRAFPRRLGIEGASISHLFVNQDLVAGALRWRELEFGSVAAMHMANFPTEES